MTPPPDPTLAHELRTPLHAVLASVALLGETSLTAEQREHVDIIREAARALLDLAESTLDTAGAPAHPDTTCDVRRVVDGVRRLLAPTALERALALDVLVDADVPAAIHANAGPLRQVLVNLVGNAIKFTAAGSVSIHVRRDASVPNDAEHIAVLLEVRDSGPGIDAERQRTLFRPFERGANGTTGLGLAIASALVRRMGGTIGVHSAPGEGSTFWVRLSAWADAAPSPVSNAIPAARTVLVVDDDPVGRRVTARLVERLGACADSAASLAEAEAALAHASYDVVLLDRHLPDGDGCEFAERYRGQTRFVALTASADPTTRRRCVAAGMDACLVKPVGIAELRHALGALPDSVAPVIDEARLATLSRLEADAPGLLARVADDYRRGAEELLTTLRAAIARGDRSAAARAAHTLRGSSASAGAPRASAIAAEIERASLDGDPVSSGAVDALAVAVRAAAASMNDRRIDATTPR